MQCRLSHSPTTVGKVHSQHVYTYSKYILIFNNMVNHVYTLKIKVDLSNSPVEHHKILLLLSEKLPLTLHPRNTEARGETSFLFVRII